MHALALDMDKHSIDLMMTIRRRVKAEFNEAIKLSDDQLIDTLKTYFTRSVSPETKQMIGECLTGLTGEEFSDLDEAEKVEPEKTSKSKRVYRGRVIVD